MKKPTGLCKSCGAPKERNAWGRFASWYCAACDEIARAKYNIHACGADPITGGSRHYCDACREIRQQRMKEAALRGAATRRKNNPNWARPHNANMFWAGVASSMVARAKRLGILPMLDGSIACVDCGEPAIEYDHRDYGRPLDVQPVCRRCNKKRGTAIWPNADQFKFRLIADTPKPAKRAA
jgi:hypothetical protein